MDKATAINKVIITNMKMISENCTVIDNVSQIHLSMSYVSSRVLIYKSLIRYTSNLKIYRVSFLQPPSLLISCYSCNYIPQFLYSVSSRVPVGLERTGRAFWFLFHTDQNASRFFLEIRFTIRLQCTIIK